MGRKFFIIFPFLLMIIGFIGMIKTLFINDNNESSLLFSDIRGFVVDSNENIYIGLELYGKVQVYNKNGKFLRVWTTDCNQSYLELTKEDNILITSEKCREQYTYNSLGKLLKTIKKDDSFNISIQNNWNTFTSKKGKIYRINKTYNIVQSYHEKQTIVSQSLYLKVFKCTFLYWIISATGILIGVYDGYKKGLIQKNW